MIYSAYKSIIISILLLFGASIAYAQSGDTPDLPEDMGYPAAAQKEFNLPPPVQLIPTPGLTPASPLYFLDRLSEIIKGFLTASPESKARLQVKFAAERVAEIQILIEKKGVRNNNVKKAINLLGKHSAKAAAIAEKEKQKGRDISSLAAEIVANFRAQKDAAKAAFEDAKKGFETKKRELKSQLKEARGNTVLEIQLKAELEALELEKDFAENEKNFTINALEEKKELLLDDLKEERRAEEARMDAEEEITEVESELKELMDETARDGVALPQELSAKITDLIKKSHELFDQGNFRAAKGLAEQAEDVLDEMKKTLEELGQEDERDVEENKESESIDKNEKENKETSVKKEKKSEKDPD